MIVQANAAINAQLNGWAMEFAIKHAIILAAIMIKAIVIRLKMGLSIKQSCYEF